MKTVDELVQASTEFVCETWGAGEASITFYAPVTRWDGGVWIHAAWARDLPWCEVKTRATRIWSVRGSLWNPLAFKLIWSAAANGGEDEGSLRPAISPLLNERERGVAGEDGEST
jgi:hypothetical protein